VRFFVFVDTPYYPYVDDEIEAESVEAAQRKVSEGLWPGDHTTVYVVPAETVRAVRCYGPRTRGTGALLELQDQHNRLREQQREAMADMLHGGYSVVVEGGSIEP
jgi:hypothetical protein